MFKTITVPKRTIMTPGPVEVNPKVLQVMSNSILGQYDPVFLDIMNEVKELIKQPFGTKNEQAFAIDGSSRSGIEAAMIAILEKGDKVLIPAFGLTLEKGVFEQLIARLQVGQIVKMTPKLWTFYMRPTLLQLVPSKLNKVVLGIPKVTREDLRNSQLLMIIEEVRALENSGFAHSENLMSALKQWSHEEEIPEQLIRDLVGAGIGLTPSGDDFLQGLLLIESALGEKKRLCQQVETVLKDRTTTAVSHAYYSALFAGKVNLSWVNLLRAVKAQASVATITALVQDIQHYGATSGNDILVGIATGLKSI